MKRIPEKFPDELLATGVFLSLTLLAVFQQLEFALDYPCMTGKDWFLHYHNAMQIHALRFDLSQILEFYKFIGSGIAHYPPFTYLISSLFLLFDQWDTAIAIYASRTIFIVVLAGSLYLAGWKLGKNPWTGLIAASVGCLNPMVLMQAHDIILEFPAASMVALALWGYTLTNSFEKTLPSLLLGFFCGIGMLVKPSVFFFLAPFLLTAFLLPEKAKRVFAKKRLDSVIAFLFSSALVTSLYYLPQLETIWTEGSTATVLQMADLLSNILLYLRQSSKIFLPYWLVLPVLVLIAYSVWKKLKWPWPYLTTCLVSFIFLIGLHSATYQYLYPYQVFFALAAAQSLSMFQQMAKRVVGALIVTIVSLPLLWFTPELGIEDGTNWPDTVSFHKIFATRYAETDYHNIYVGSFAHNRITDLVAVLALEWPGKLKKVAFLVKGSPEYNSACLMPRFRNVDMDEFIRSAVDSEFTVLVRPRGPIPHQDGEEYWNRLMTILNDPAGRHRLDFVYESLPNDRDGCQVYFYTSADASPSSVRDPLPENQPASE